MSKLSAAVLGVVLGLSAVAFFNVDSPEVARPDAPAIRLADDPAFDGYRYRSKTFSLAVGDLNGDNRDDILIGAHNQNPFLLINTASGFVDESTALFDRPRRDDRHGYTLADFDNDGRLDVLIACGGTDGVGEGWPNLSLRNKSTGAALRFVEQTVGEDFALAPGRSRAFIPLPSADGGAVDLYYATLERDGHTNLLFRYAGATASEPYIADRLHFLSRQFNDQGRGALADLDGDGGRDYLLVENERARIHWFRDGGAQPLELADAASTVQLADFNNDGLLDVFVGRANRQSLADRISFAGDGMIFTLHNNAKNDRSAVSFRSASISLAFDLNQWVPTGRSQRLEDTSHIFLGRAGRHPGKREFTADRGVAAGEPENRSAPGIYIWYTPEDDAWHMHWTFHPGLNAFKGTVTGDGLEELTREGFYAQPSRTLADQVFLNAGSGRFTKLELAESLHAGVTHSATVADFNSDGWLDVLGVRHADQGDGSLSPFLLINHGPRETSSLTFTQTLLPQRDEDRLHRADHVVHGFFNADDLPDAFITNGYGQIPGTNGVPRLLLNATEQPGGSLRLLLKGSRANRFAVGALVSGYNGNDLIGYRVAGLNANTSQDTSWLHFGLGERTGPFRVTVTWPDGSFSEHVFAAGGRYEVVQP